jgi:glycerate dehydrogenase
MGSKPSAVLLDFATLGPNVDTRSLDELVAARYFDYSACEELGERLTGAEIAILNKVKLDRDAIASATDLKLIVLTATGTDNVDCAAAKERGIGVANVRDYCSAAVAQHVFALILGLTHHVGAYDALARSGAWGRSRSFALFDYPIRELAGRTLGVVGFGSLGKAVAHLGRCFGMEVMVSARPGGDDEEPGGARVPFATVLREADVLSLHCPLTKETQHMIGAGELKQMKRDGLLINTARGGLIDGKALAAALRDGEIAGASIDVLPVEPPPPDEPLLERGIPNLIVTPHIAWSAREARQRALEQVVENIASFMAGGRLRRVV